METKTIQFAVRDNNNFFKLDIPKSLLHLIEFDFTYFWERCIDAGRIAKKSGRLPQTAVSNAKNIISGIHPYVDALINDDFSDIVTDCIIEYICHSERIGLEELWVRCISPKNLYEQAIFKRISQYKTGKAINQWGNIIKIQEYARNKVSFIYDCDEEKIPQPHELIITRKEYFDLAYSMAANELGMQGEKLPSVRVCSAALMPNATFLNAKVSKAIYRRFAEVLKLGGDMSVPQAKNCELIRDQLAMDAYAYVRGMKRPAEIDMKFALEALKNNAAKIYMPDSFKAAVDLEFDIMVQENIVLRKCDTCGRYFAAYDDGFFCDRVNSSGKTCIDQYREMCRAIAEAAAENAKQEFAVEVADSKSVVIPIELEKHGQRIYNALYKRVGKGMEENEFREWSRYLSDMKRNIKIGEASVEQLEEFLQYSDKLWEEVKAAGKNKAAKAEFNYPEVKSAEVTEKPAPVFNEEVKKPTEPPTITRVVSAENVEIKPFRPETFDTLIDAFMAEKTTAPDDASPDKPTKKAVEIKAPQWKRMTREEAYGFKMEED